MSEGQKIRKAIVWVFFFFYLASPCFAYTLEPYSGESVLPSRSRLNLVFCSLHYESESVFLKDVDAFVAKLRAVKPFDEFIKEIGLYRVTLSKEEEGLIFKKAAGFPPLKARLDFLEDVSSRLKSERNKIIILDASGGVSCGELSSLGKMSLVILGRARHRGRDNFAKGFLHELGHSLGLRDEGLGREAARCLPGPPNCAVNEDEAKSWWGDLAGSVPGVGYIHGSCGNINYLRPTIASLMNDPDKAGDFGPVNERYLRKVLRGNGT